MSQVTEFVSNNSILVFAFIGLAGGLVWTFIGGRTKGVARLGPVQVTQLINTDDAVVIDVRGDGEFRQGHIINSVNIAESQFESKAGELDKYKTRKVITVCRTGQASAKAAAALKQREFEHVHTLAGGLMAWESAGLPLARK